MQMFLGVAKVQLNELAKEGIAARGETVTRYVEHLRSMASGFSFLPPLEPR
jgi:hypothetical protein